MYYMSACLWRKELFVKQKTFQIWFLRPKERISRRRCEVHKVCSIGVTWCEIQNVKPCSSVHRRSHLPCHIANPSEVLDILDILPELQQEFTTVEWWENYILHSIVAQLEGWRKHLATSHSPPACVRSKPLQTRSRMHNANSWSKACGRAAKGMSIRCFLVGWK